jgi:hypothetical protein
MELVEIEKTPAQSPRGFFYGNHLFSYICNKKGLFLPLSLAATGF